MYRQFLFLMLTALPNAPSSAQAALPWELTPYRVSVLVAAQSSVELPPAIEQELAAAIAARSAAIVGGSWKLTATPAVDELRAAILAEASQVTAADLGAAAKDTDKVILLAVGSAKYRAGFRVQAREWDALTNLWNAPVAVDVAQADLLSQAAFRAVLAAFAPLARIENTSGDSATLRLRAGAIAHRDSNLARVHPGVVFRPVLVASDSRGTLKPGEARLVEWTYLTPVDADGGLLRSSIETGLVGSPIPEYHPLRQRLALGVSPSSRGTQLKFVSRGEKAEPLEGYDVLEEGPAPKLLGRSDRGGQVLIAPGPTALRLVLIRHGEQALLRLPLAPGLESEITLPVADVRGAALLDAALAELEDTLVDLAAQREVLKARVQGAGGDSAAQDQLRERLAKLPRPDALAARLLQYEQAAKAGEPLAQARLLAKIAELRKLLEQMEGKSAAP